MAGAAMKIQITKTWYTETEVEIPDDKTEDFDYLANLCDEHDVDSSTAKWDSTCITNVETDVVLAEW